MANRFSYVSSTGSATVTVPEGAVVLQVAVQGGSFSINGGDSIQVPSTFQEYPKGAMQGEINLTFVDTTAYYVSWSDY